MRVVSVRLLRIVVVSSLSPKPSWATPLNQPVSLKPGVRQTVPWSEPSSRYFHAAPNGISVVFTPVGGAGTFGMYDEAAPVISPFTGFESTTRSNVRPAPRLIGAVMRLTVSPGSNFSVPFATGPYGSEIV